MIINIPTKIIYQNVKKERIGNVELHIRDKQGGSIDFSVDV